MDQEDQTSSVGVCSINMADLVESFERYRSRVQDLEFEVDRLREAVDALLLRRRKKTQYVR